MPKFKVEVEWVERGYFYVDADSKKKANDLVEEDDREFSIGKAHGEYVDDSFKVVNTTQLSDDYCEDDE